MIRAMAGGDDSATRIVAQPATELEAPASERMSAPAARTAGVLAEFGRRPGFDAPRPLTAFEHACDNGRIRPKVTVATSTGALQRSADTTVHQGDGRIRRSAAIPPVTANQRQHLIRRVPNSETDTTSDSGPDTTSRVTNTPEQSGRAKKGWGKLRSVVDKSREFNVGTNPTKRSDESDKTTTAGGAWLASQVDSKQKIGSVDDYMGSRDDADSQHSKHLEQFLGGGHAFITVWHHKNFFNLNEDGSGWGGWGQDANFIAPLGEADELVAKAAKEGARGIWDLEVALGIPTGSWVSKCAPSYSIYRYKVHDPAALNVRIPSGSESGAYGSWWSGDKYQAGQWQPKGQTEGGAAEAVIDKISLEKLQKLGSDVLEIVEEKSLAANTKRVVDENAASAGPPSST
jgi:hypothetical protein